MSSGRGTKRTYDYRYSKYSKRKPANRQFCSVLVWVDCLLVDCPVKVKLNAAVSRTILHYFASRRTTANLLRITCNSKATIRKYHQHVVSNLDYRYPMTHSYVSMLVRNSVCHGSVPRGFIIHACDIGK